jgi:hypothetical protein
LFLRIAEATLYQNPRFLEQCSAKVVTGFAAKHCDNKNSYSKTHVLLSVRSRIHNVKQPQTDSL